MPQPIKVDVVIVVYVVAVVVIVVDYAAVVIFLLIIFNHSEGGWEGQNKYMPYICAFMHSCILAHFHT